MKSKAGEMLRLFVVGTVSSGGSWAIGPQHHRLVRRDAIVAVMPPPTETGYLASSVEVRLSWGERLFVSSVSLPPELRP